MTNVNEAWRPYPEHAEPEENKTWHREYLGEWVGSEPETEVFVPDTHETYEITPDDLFDEDDGDYYGGEE